MLGSILGIILLGIVIAILISCVKIVKQAQALVVERLGAYQATGEPVFILRFRSSTGWQEE